ncbi:MAG: hypothetical protein N3B15_00675, partial [Planctomycetota bacterium]|nr:hypothetical protein [Planctomycetota bacterium]
MSYDLAALEQRFAQQLQGDAEDFAAALVTAGWLLGAGRRAAAAALREQAAARGIDLEGLLQRRLTETMADLARTTGAERGLRIAQAQGLYRLAQHWGLAVAAAAWVEMRAASLPLDLAAREWIAAWRAECPQ